MKQANEHLGIAALALAFGLAFTSAVANALEEHTHLLRRQTLASCRYDRDCVENAYCWNQQTCLCMEGYLVDRNHTHVQCLRIATALGDPCTMDVQCRVTFAAQAECRANECQCSIGSHFEEGRCYESIRIGHACQTSHNCYVKDSPSYCLYGICTCPFQHHPNIYGTRCIKSSFLGDQCSEDEECVARNSRCFNICRCKVDYVISSDKKKCLKAANAVGELCEEDSQCQEFMTNTYCSEGKCTCIRNFHQRGHVCVKSVILNQACEEHQQCLTPTNKNSIATEVTNADCVNGICICAPEYTLTEDRLDCIRYSENGAEKWQISWLLWLIAVTVFFVNINDRLNKFAEDTCTVI